MAKYHINPDTGRPNICNPEKTGVCAYVTNGENPPHYENKTDAEIAYEKVGAREWGTVSTFKKKELLSSVSKNHYTKNSNDSFSFQNMFTQDEIENYTQGDCAFLASAIIDTRPDDFTMVLMIDENDSELDLEDGTWHVVAEHNDTGLLLDITGINSWNEKEQNILKDWNTHDMLQSKEGIEQIKGVTGSELTLDYYYEYGGHSPAFSNHEDQSEKANKILEVFDSILQYRN